MRRREFIAGLGSAAAWPNAARAQQSAVPVIGLVSLGSADDWADYMAAFRKGLGETGYVEGQNVTVEYHYLEDQYDRLPALAADLVRRRVAVIVAVSSDAALAAKAATTTIPIVFNTGTDPVASGLVASLNRPGANVTGSANLGAELAPKKLQLLRELLPNVTRFGFLADPAVPNIQSTIADLRAAARVLGSHALTVAQYLENTFGKRNIFIDIDRLRAGQKFDTVLEDKLGQCKVMLAIIGPNWIDARDGRTGSRRLDNPEDWVRLELERALARNVPVIPVLVAGATLPSNSELPPTLQPLLDHQCAAVTTNGFRYDMAGLARDEADLTVARPWGRMAAAAFALILGGYVVAHQYSAPVWWPSFGLGQPSLLEAPSKPPAKEMDSTAKSNADAAEAEAKRKAEVARDPALSVTPGSGKTFHWSFAHGGF
jgi:hypothetical protein